jgi:predicted alternative tryptophan synthase beta-subunit
VDLSKVLVYKPKYFMKNECPSPDGSEKLRGAIPYFFLTEKSDQRKLLLWL